MSFPADAIGHHLEFIHPPERDYLRTAACTGCDFQAPAPGSGYGRGRQLHTEAHHHLTWRCDQCGAMAAEHIDNRCPDTEGDDRAGLLRGIACAVPAGLTMWAAIGWLTTRW